MPKSTDICVFETSTEMEYFPYRAPMKFGGRVVRDVSILHISVHVRTRDGREAVGRGSMPMGNVWAWPDPNLPVDQTLWAMIDLGQRIADKGRRPDDFGHPLELIHRFSQEYQALAEETAREMNSDTPVKLAQLVAASPFDAAVFDAYGRVLGTNSYNLLSQEYCNTDLSHYLGDKFKGEYLDRYVLSEPKGKMPLYHLVGALDPLEAKNVETPLGDGLPEHLADWIPFNALTHLKIKLNGDDLEWDVDRVLHIDYVTQTAQEKLGVQNWYYSADFNERCERVDYVLEFLRRIGMKSPRALERLQYIEQPTHRDLKSHPESLMHEAAAIKPVVIDEALVDFDSLLLSRKMGYSGVALKACKGHSEALLMGAAAQKYGMFLCVQDLTCPGASFLHSASLAARIPTVSAIEGNARQYCPAANISWTELYPGMFAITDGTLQTSVLNESGLGFHWP